MNPILKGNKYLIMKENKLLPVMKRTNPEMWITFPSCTFDDKWFELYFTKAIKKCAKTLLRYWFKQAHIKTRAIAYEYGHKHTLTNSPRMTIWVTDKSNL